MTNNLLGWRQYRGRIIPRSTVEQVTKNFRPYDTRLKLGEHVKLRIDDAGTTQFLGAVVVDVAQSHRNGATYALAFPATVEGDFYIVVDGFSGAGMQLTHDESAEASGIYTEAEYAQYELENVKSSPAPHRTLKLVTSALDDTKVAAEQLVSNLQ
jgi:hypothetical protein